MSGSTDDLPSPPPKRGAVRPPPHSADEAPASIDVPRMEPPPASLEAMISTEKARTLTGVVRWLLVLLMVGMAVAATRYVLQ